MSELITRDEIFQQPVLWPTTLDRVQSRAFHCAPVITGAGTSAYAASAIAVAWPGANAIATTDLLLYPSQFFSSEGLLISISRSGESPESYSTVQEIQDVFPGVKHLAITCNRDGRLAKVQGIEVILLDPRTNDRSLVMTSSFSNLLLAGIALMHRGEIERVLPDICRRAEAMLPAMDEIARRVTSRTGKRVSVLASRELFSVAREGSLKVLEMTGGKFVALPETFLGLRHGPMSFLEPDSLVLCFLSGDRRVLRYEQDLLADLRSKKLGRIVVVSPVEVAPEFYDEFVPSLAPELPDALRAPFDVVFAQLIGLHLSQRAGLNPDSPSPDGVIHRVVQGVRIHGK